MALTAQQILQQKAAQQAAAGMPATNTAMPINMAQAAGQAVTGGLGGTQMMQPRTAGTAAPAPAPRPGFSIKTAYGPNVKGAPQTGLVGAQRAQLGGLRGFEGATAQGLTGSTAAINQGLGGAQRAITGARGQALDLLNDPSGINARQASSTIKQGTTSALRGLNATQRQVQGQLAAGTSDVDAQAAAAGNFGAQDARGAFQQGAQGLEQFAGQGRDANQQQAALSGALGPEAQAKAYAAYQESPGQSYLREQGERAITRNAAATGGLGGSRVLQELQKQGIGMAAQDFDASFNRLGSLAERGAGAAGQQASLRGQEGGVLGSLAGQRGQAQTETNITNAGNTLQADLANQGLQADMAKTGAQITAGLGGQKADIASTMAGQAAGLQGAANLAAGQERSQNARTGAGIAAGLGGQLADIRTGAGEAKAGLTQGAASDTAAARLATGQSLGQDRTQAGQNIATNAAATSEQIAGLLANQGAGLADMLGQAGGDVATVLNNLGLTQGQAYDQVAAALANIKTNQATQVAGLPGLGGTQGGGGTGIAPIINAGATAYSAYKQP